MWPQFRKKANFVFFFGTFPRCTDCINQLRNWQQTTVSESVATKSGILKERSNKAEMEAHNLAKPGWLKRRLIWPLKANVLKSLSFKLILLVFGVARYWGDVGLDINTVIDWANMRGCFR